MGINARQSARYRHRHPHHTLPPLADPALAPALLLLQVVYERALAVFPVTHYLWLAYARYLEIHLKIPAVVNAVYARAGAGVLSCPLCCAALCIVCLALSGMFCCCCSCLPSAAGRHAHQAPAGLIMHCVIVHFLLIVTRWPALPAVRNCPWVGELWSRYLRALERGGADDARHAAVFQEALEAGVQVRCAALCWWCVADARTALTSKRAGQSSKPSASQPPT